MARKTCGHCNDTTRKDDFASPHEVCTEQQFKGTVCCGGLAKRSMNWSGVRVSPVRVCEGVWNTSHTLPSTPSPYPEHFSGAEWLEWREGRLLRAVPPLP